jgi:hypothetical protein
MFASTVVTPHPPHLTCAAEQEFFPHIFGPEEDQPLDAAAARAALADLAREVNASNAPGQPEKSVDEVRRPPACAC